MSVEHNKHLVQHTFAELFSGGDLALADALVGADFFTHEVPPGAPRGPAVLRQMATMLRTAFPDIRYTTEEVIGEGDKGVVRTTLRGTHTGPFMGLAPTGQRVEQAQIHIVRFAVLKAVDHLVVRDDLGLLRLVGVFPACDPVWEYAFGRGPVWAPPD